MGVWGLATGRDDLAGARERTAFGFKVDYPNDLFDCFVLYRRVGDGFDPSLGFVARPGVNSYESGCTYAPRPKDSFVRQLTFQLYPILTTDLGGRWESYEVLTSPLGLLFESGDRIGIGVVPTGERLVKAFEVAEEVVIPPGSYHFWRTTVEVQGAAKRRLSGDAAYSFGGFYDGTLQQWEADVSFTPSPLVTFLLNAEHDRGRLPEGNFDLTLVGVKFRLNLSPDLQLNSFVQYDTESRTLGTNTRLRWTFNPRGDLFVVYNHNLAETDGVWRRASQRSSC